MELITPGSPLPLVPRPHLAPRAGCAPARGPELPEVLMALPWKQAIEVCLLMGLSFVLLTVNYRAVAQASYVGSVVTDVMICLLNWSLFKRIQETRHWLVRIGYTVGGGLGSILGIWMSLHLLGK